MFLMLMFTLGGRDNGPHAANGASSCLSGTFYCTGPCQFGTDDVYLRATVKA